MASGTAENSGLRQENDDLYMPFRENGLHGLVRRGWNFSHTPEALLRRLDEPDSHICKDRPKIKAVLAEGYFLKRYNTLGFFNALRRAFRPPRPERALLAAERLRTAGIPTPEVFAALRRSRFGIPRCDYLVTAALAPEECNALELTREMLIDTDYSRIMDGVVAMMVKMHQSGVEHGDLNLRNLFFRRRRDGSGEEWGVIDLDGCRVYFAAVPFKRRRRELARVVSSLLRAAPELKIYSGEVLAAFTERYRALSGCDLQGGALNKRTAYLTERVRKDQLR